jgi:hypothetical protein
MFRKKILSLGFKNWKGGGGGGITLSSQMALLGVTGLNISFRRLNSSNAGTSFLYLNNIVGNKWGLRFYR